MDLLNWLKGLETIKQDYEGLWQDIAKFVNPRRELIKDSQRFDKKGQRRGKDGFDGTPSAALGVWRDGMQGFMVAQGLRWFRSEMSDYTLNDVDEVRAFLQEYDEAMYASYNRSNFYSILNEWFSDAGSIGTAPLYTEENISNGNTVHTPIHPREIFIAENMYQEVDVLFRKFQLTARQAIRQFDKDKLSSDIVSNAKDHPEKMHEFVHAVFPNNELLADSLLSTNKRFKSVYLQRSGIQGKADDGKIVKEGGYDIFPYAVWRFRKNSDEIYGYSPAADAMIEIYSLNQIGKTMLKAAHLSVSSPWNVPEHMRGNVRIEPDGFNYFDDPTKILMPVRTEVKFPIGIDREERLQRLVEEKYRVEFFRAFIGSKREKTATEILRIQGEQAQLMGPQVDRLVNEGLNKNFNIVASIEERAGRLPQPPQILIDRVLGERERGGQKTKINIRFTGPLAQAQRRLFKLQPIKNGLNELGVASVLFPNITDIVKEVDLGEEILDSSDFPQRLMRSAAEVREIRDARAAKQVEMEMQQQLQAAAEGYKKTTKAPEPNSPAEALVGA